MMAQASTMTARPRTQPDMNAATRCNDVLRAVGSGAVLLMSIPPPVLPETPCGLPTSRSRPARCIRPATPALLPCPSGLPQTRAFARPLVPWPQRLQRRIACFGPGGTRTASGDGGIARYARHRGPKQCGKPASTPSLANPGAPRPPPQDFKPRSAVGERGETTGLAEVDVLRPCSSGGSNQPRQARVPREGSPAPQPRAGQ